MLVVWMQQSFVARFKANVCHLTYNGIGLVCKVDICFMRCVCAHVSGCVKAGLRSSFCLMGSRDTATLVFASMMLKETM